RAGDARARTVAGARSGPHAGGPAVGARRRHAGSARHVVRAGVPGSVARTVVAARHGAHVGAGNGAANAAAAAELGHAVGARALVGRRARGPVGLRGGADPGRARVLAVVTAHAVGVGAAGRQAGREPAVALVVPAAR